MMEMSTPPPTTGNTYSRSHTSVKESDDCANVQIKVEAQLDSNGQSIEDENLDNDNIMTSLPFDSQDSQTSENLNNTQETNESNNL